MNTINIIVIIGALVILIGVILVFAKKENGRLKIGKIELAARQAGLFYLIAGVVIIVSAVGINITIKIEFAKHEREKQELKWELANAKMLIGELKASLETSEGKARTY